MQVSAHKDAVSLFERYSNGGDNADLKAWAGKTLPALRHHLEMAEQLEKRSNGRVTAGRLFVYGTLNRGFRCMRRDWLVSGSSAHIEPSMLIRSLSRGHGLRR